MLLQQQLINLNDKTNVVREYGASFVLNIIYGAIVFFLLAALILFIYIIVRRYYSNQLNRKINILKYYIDEYLVAFLCSDDDSEINTVYQNFIRNTSKVNLYKKVKIEIFELQLNILQQAVNNYEQDKLKFIKPL